MKEKANYGNSDNYTASVAPMAQKRESLTSEGQKALWFLCQTQKFKYSYCEQVSVEVDRPLDIHRFTQCINVLIERHESLRTVFKETEDGELLQVVNEPYLIEIPVVLIQDEKADSQTLEEQISTESQKQGQIQYNLEKDPPFRVSILQLPDNRQIVLLSFYHLIMDGRSIDIILNEWKALDSEFFNNTMPKLAKLPLQFSDFTAWESQFLSSETSKTYKEYWGKKFATPPEFINLPYDQPWTPNTRKLSAREHIKIDTNTVGKLKNLEKETRCSVNTILLAAMQVLLMRYSGQTDICIGSQRANRKFNEFNAIIGYFTNVVAIRSDLSGEKTFKELLLAVKSSTKEADYKYQLPYSTVTNIARENGLPSDVPLCQVVLEFGGFSSKSIQLDSGPNITRVRNRSMGDSKFPLLFAFLIEEGELVGHIEYDIDLFNQDTIQRFYQHYLILLNSIIEDPSQNIHAIPLLTKAERKKVLFDWNQTDAPYPHDKTLHQLFEEQMAKTPHNIALVFEGEELTYQALNQRANQLAYVIRERYQQRNQSPMPPDTLIGLYLDRGPEMVISILATLKAGGAYVPISPEYPKERTLFMLEDTQASVLLTQQRFMEVLDQWLPELPHTPDLLAADDVDLTADLPTLNPEPTSKPTDLAYVIYTSGTTGKPKGVMLPHFGVVNRIHWMQSQYPLDSSDKVLQKTPYTFDVSVWELLWANWVGATIVMAAPQIHKDPEALNTLIQKIGVTTIHFVPSMLSSFCQYLAQHELQLPESLRQVFCSGEALTPVHIKEFKNVSHPCNALHNLYGPTEASIDVTYFDCSEFKNGLVPIGRAINNTRLLVLNEQKRLVPIGAPGELYIGGAGLALGYLNRPELTQERFVDNPFATEADKEKGYNTLYKTGDIVRWLPDGNLEYLGRNDFQVKIRGFRIELGEIESALADLPDVKQVVVIDRERDGNKYLSAYLVAEADVSIDEEQLRESLASSLPEYMVPSTFTFIDTLPLTINGKLDRRALPEPEFVSGDSYVPPRNELEAQLCSIWQTVLGLERIGVNDNFFRIGGNSITAIKLTATSRNKLGVDIPLDLLFQYKTIAGISPELNQQSMIVIPKTKVNQPPLSFAQERLLFIERFENGTDSYHIPHIFQLDSNVNFEALEKSLNLLINRHPTLKTIYLSDESGNDYQHILETNITIKKKDLAGGDFKQLLSAIKTDISQPFDLATEPSIRLSLYKFGEKLYLLILTHHIALDGWSLDILYQELGKIYNTLCQEKSIKLPDLEISYVDYSVWQRKYLQGETLEKFLNYWRQQLSDYQNLTLPTDLPRPKRVNYQGKNHVFTLDANLSQQLRDLAKTYETTLYTVLLSAFYVTLARLSGQTDIVVGTPSDNRHHAQTQPLIGFFVNSLALRVKIESTTTIGKLITQVHRIVTKGKVYQELPFEKLVDELSVERDTSRHPIFQTMFSVQNFGESIHKNFNLPFLPVDFSKEQEIYTPAKFDLSLFLNDAQSEIIGEFNYAVSLFRDETIKRMEAIYQRVLEAFVEHQKQSISHINVLSEEERYTLLHAWNQTEAPYPLNKTLHQLFEDQVDKTPNRTALVFDNQELTYRVLNKKANQLARVIQERYQQRYNNAIQPDTLVALYLDRSLEMVISILAVLKAGAAYVPISPEHPKERVQFILQDAQVPILLTQQHHVHTLNDWLQELPDAPDMLAVDNPDLTANIPTDNFEAINQATDLAYVIYTSGTTGQPKGVEISHQASASRNMYMSRLGETKKNVYLFKTNYIFDVSVSDLFSHLLVGAKIIVTKSSFEPQEIENILEKQEVNAAHFVPSQFSALGTSERFSPNLDRIYFSGESLTGEQLKQIDFSRTQVINYYGPTETGEATSYIATSADCSNIIGRPFPGTTVYVLQENLSVAPIGAPGELYIGGIGLARGYLNRPELTQERFIDNPFATKEDYKNGNGKLYKTGDMVRWLPDGNLKYLGRNDFQVKIRGFRVELGEIENTLLNTPNIKQAVVTDRERNGNKYLAAYLVTETDVLIDERQLREHLAIKLPEYMVPSTFTFIDSIPLTVNGKLDRRALPEPKFVSEENYVEPRNDLEAELCEIWQSVLGVDKIGIHDNFFELGGNSLLSMIIISKMNKQLDANLTISNIFENPTIDKLCKLIKKVKTGSNFCRSILPISRSNAMPLSSEEKFYFNLEIQETKANIQYKHSLHGPLNKKALIFGLLEIINRHEVFRTTYYEKEGKLFRKIKNSTGNEIRELDLRGKIISEHDVIIENQVKSDYRTVNISNGPAFLASIIQLSRNYHILLITTSHAINDGWSESIFREELSYLYRCYQERKHFYLEPLSIQYADYAHWQQQKLNLSKHDDIKSYWENKLSNFPPRLKLSISDACKNSKENKFSTIPILLSDATTNKILKIIKEKNSTTYVFFLSILNILLCKYSNESTVMSFSPLANRSFDGTNNIVGCFLSAIFIKEKIDFEENFDSLLNKTKNIYLDELSHEIPISWIWNLLSNALEYKNTQLLQFEFSINKPHKILDLAKIKTSSQMIQNLSSRDENLRLVDFSIRMSELIKNSSCSGIFTYNQRSYDETSANKIVNDFCYLTCKLIDNPLWPLREIKLE